MSYIQINELVKEKRLAARYSENGKFCFKKIKAGNYLIRINTQKTELLKFSALSTIYLFVTVDPKTKSNKNQNLELTFELAI
jgi:hypothetical protein